MSLKISSALAQYVLASHLLRFWADDVHKPPATHLPVIRDVSRPLTERYATKHFRASDFERRFWRYLQGSVITEIDVHGVRDHSFPLCCY